MKFLYRANLNCFELTKMYLRPSAYHLLFLLAALSSSVAGKPAEIMALAESSGWTVYKDDFQGTFSMEWKGEPRSLNCHGGGAFVSSYLDPNSESVSSLSVTLYLQLPHTSHSSGLIRWKHADSISELPITCTRVGEVGSTEFACSWLIGESDDLESFSQTDYVRIELGDNFDFRQQSGDDCGRVVSSLNRLTKSTLDLFEKQFSQESLERTDLRKILLGCASLSDELSLMPVEASAPTRRVRAISKRLYKQMVEAQIMIDPESIPREADEPAPVPKGTPQDGIQKLLGMTKNKRLNPNELSQLWNLLAFGYYTLEDVEKTIFAYEEVIKIARSGPIPTALEANAYRALTQLKIATNDLEDIWNYIENAANLGDNVKWDPLESTCRHASLSIL